MSPALKSMQGERWEEKKRAWQNGGEKESGNEEWETVR